MLWKFLLNFWIDQKFQKSVSSDFKIDQKLQKSSFKNQFQKVLKFSKAGTKRFWPISETYRIPPSPSPIKMYDLLGQRTTSESFMLM